MTRLYDFKWTPAYDHKLAQLWNQKDPVLTAKQIGEHFGGLSKSSILGRVHRLDLPRRESPIVRDPNAPAPPPRPPSVPLAMHRTGALPTPEPVKPIFPEFSKHPCSWPIGSPKAPDFRFCNAKALWGRSYCPEHLKIAYVRKCDHGAVDHLQQSA